VNPGKQEGGGREKNQKIGDFSFRGILQPTTEREREDAEEENNIRSRIPRIVSFAISCTVTVTMHRACSVVGLTPGRDKGSTRTVCEGLQGNLLSENSFYWLRFTEG